MLRADEGSIQIELDDSPEFLVRRPGDWSVRHGRSAGIVVQDMQPAERLDRLRDRRLHAFVARHIGFDEYRLAAVIASGLACQPGRLGAACGISTMFSAVSGAC